MMTIRWKKMSVGNEVKSNWPKFPKVFKWIEIGNEKLENELKYTQMDQITKLQMDQSTQMDQNTNGSMYKWINVQMD